MAPATDRSRLRRTLAWVALVVGCVALLAANLAVFLKAFVFEQDTFVAAVAPREPDEAVIDGLADTLSARILDAVGDDDSLVAGIVADSAGDVITSVLREVLQSDAFRTVWRAAVERAHTAFVHVIEDDDRESVVLNLTQTLSDVDERLERRGIDLLDDTTIEDIGQVVTVRRDQLDEVRGWLDLLQRFSLPLAVLAVALPAAAVALAPDRRRMLLWTGVGVTLTMLVTAVALRATRTHVTGSIEIDTRRAAVVSLWNRVFDNLAQQTALLLALGLLLTLTTWLTGPSTPATAIRHRLTAPPPPPPPTGNRHVAATAPAPTSALPPNGTSGTDDRRTAGPGWTFWDTNGFGACNPSRRSVAHLCRSAGLHALLSGGGADVARVGDWRPCQWRCMPDPSTRSTWATSV